MVGSSVAIGYGDIHVYSWHARLNSIILSILTELFERGIIKQSQQ